MLQPTLIEARRVSPYADDPALGARLHGGADERRSVPFDVLLKSAAQSANGEAEIVLRVAVGRIEVDQIDQPDEMIPRVVNMERLLACAHPTIHVTTM